MENRKIVCKGQRVRRCERRALAGSGKNRSDSPPLVFGVLSPSEGGTKDEKRGWLSSGRERELRKRGRSVANLNKQEGRSWSRRGGKGDLCNILRLQKDKEKRGRKKKEGVLRCVAEALYGHRWNQVIYFLGGGRRGGGRWDAEVRRKEAVTIWLNRADRGRGKWGKKEKRERG